MHKAVNSLEKKIDGTIDVERISIVFFNKIIVHNITITGDRGDTLGTLKKLSLSFRPENLIRKRLHLHKISIEDGFINLVAENKKKETNLQRIFRLSAKKKSSRINFPPILIDDIVLSNFKFTYLNPYRKSVKKPTSCINFSDIEVSDINAKFNNAEYKDGKVTCRIKDLNCKEKTGYSLKYLNGVVSLDHGESRIDNLSFKDSYSSVNANFLSFKYSSGKDFKDFINKIDMNGRFYDTSLDFRSIGAFNKRVAGNELKIGIEGDISGPVHALRSKDLRITCNDSTLIDAEATLTGLPDIKNAAFNLNLKKIKTNSADIENIVSHFSKNIKEGSISRIMPGSEINLSGIIYGKFPDFYSTGSINSDIGNIEFETSSEESADKEKINLNASISTKNLNVGKIAGFSYLKELTMKAGLKASLGKNKKELDGVMDYMKIEKFNINGYEYKGITATGEIHKNILNLKLVSRSDAIPMVFQGVIKFRKERELKALKFFMNIPEADLKAMNIVKDEKISSAGMIANADLQFKDDNNILGSIKLNNLSYINDNGNYNIDSVLIDSKIIDGEQLITLKSPFIVAKYSSNGDPSKIIKRIKTLLMNYNFYSLTGSKDKLKKSEENSSIYKKGYYNLEAMALNINPLCSTHFPGLKIADSTKLTINLNEKDEFNLYFNSKKIFAGKNRFNGLNLNIYNDQTRINLILGGDKINLGGIILENNKITAEGVNDSIFFKYIFNNTTTPNKDSMDFSSTIAFENVKEKLITHLNIDKSKLFFKGFDWYLNPCTISFGKQYYNFRNFRLYNENEYLKINGIASPESDSSLRIDLNNFDISMVNSFIKNDFDLKGYFSGNVSMFNLFSERGIIINLNGEKVSFFNHDIDKVTIQSKWDQNKNRFNILVNNKLHDNTQFNAFGYYKPSRNFINLKLSLNNLGLQYLSPFFKDILTINGGTITGDLDISGQLDKLIISSTKCKIDSLYLMPEYTKTPYIINGNLVISEKNIALNDIYIYDQFGHRGKLNGNINHNFFNDIFLNAKLSFNKLQCLNTKEHDNEKFYGKLFATGNISLRGKLDDLKIETEFKTTENSIIHVPLLSSSSAIKSDLISYASQNKINKIDDMADENPMINLKKGENKLTHKAKIDINAKADITQETELLIEFDKQLGEVLKCKGNGNIEMKLNPFKNIMNLQGEYTIAEGSYHLALYIQSRDFIINEGGKINFNGDLKNTTLDVGATYRTKASISPLIADTTSTGNRRVVDCGIRLRGSLTNPELTFSIDIPDLDPVTKGRVESALSTPSKIQKQFMALIISGGFIPDVQSGIVNNPTILYSNASEILANQFNNIFRQLDIPLDMGLNYQPGKGSGAKDMFDVAISYQAFNDRLLINGNVGNKENSSNWAGDLDVEIKVDKNGKFRLTFFTRTPDNYSNYLDNTQRSGFGFTFQNEFDTFGEFWRNIFLSRKKREEYEFKQIIKAGEDMKKEVKNVNISKQEH